MMSRDGFGLIELIVALTILSVGLLALTGAAAVSQRSFASARATDEAVDVAAIVLDSLVRTAAPVPGERRTGRTVARWSVRADSAATTIELTVAIHDGARERRLSFQAVHHAE